jgi:signal transduction histidine kinase
MRMPRLPRFKIHLSVGLKVAGMVVLFELIMLVAYTLLTNVFITAETLQEILHLNQQNLLIVTLSGSLVLAGYLSYLVITRIFNPVSILIHGTEEVIKGNLDLKLKIETNDELQILADRFNAMAAKLKSERDTLENKVRERTRELEESQKKELERQKDVLRIKDEFLFVAAHELRTPVTAIRWSLESVDNPKKLSLEVQEALNDAISASRTLAELVEDLLNMARLDSNRLEFAREPVDLIALVNATLKELAPIAERKEVALKVDVGDGTTKQALADARRLREVLVNLIGNAIKFNKLKGKVLVHVGVAGDRVSLRVEDSGPGISPEDQKHVFEKFWRSKAQSSVEGSGLGLFITKRLVDGMGGEIGFESVPGKGTTFKILLPSA